MFCRLERVKFGTKTPVMIQRIQSLFLLISMILCGVLFFTPFFEFSSATGQLYELTCKGLFHITNSGKEAISINQALMAFLIVILVFHLASIFLYKNRIRQIRFIIAVIVFLIAYWTTVIYLGYNFSKELKLSMEIKFSTSLLLVSAILDYLAIYFIRKDESLIRSVDRIR